MSTDEARRAVERYFEAFNARDGAALRGCLNYPHVRLASGRVLVIPSEQEHRTAFDLLQTRERWDHSTLDDVRVVQAGADKVHLAVTFSRHRQGGERYASYESLWIVTCVDGRWGVQARSSFAP